METTFYRKLDIKKISKRKHHVITSEEALKDIVPFNWSDDVKNGKKKVIIK